MKVIYVYLYIYIPFLRLINKFPKVQNSFKILHELIEK